MHLAKHAHGKSRVRVARVWREGTVHHAVEWQCEVLLESDMAPAYLRGDNSDMTATDTIKNTVRAAALPAAAQPTKPPPACAPGICAGVLRGQAAASALHRGAVRRGARGALLGGAPEGAAGSRMRGQARETHGACAHAQLLLAPDRCPLRTSRSSRSRGRAPPSPASPTTTARARAPWRASCCYGLPRRRRRLPCPCLTPCSCAGAGFTTTAPGTRMAYVLARRGKPTTVSAGLENLSVLKTTQSGYEGFGRGPLTSLPDTRERMLATTLSATWAYTKAPPDYDAAYDAVMHSLCDTFFGPARGGVYSPGVQATLYAMGCAVLARVGAVSSVSLALPNLHFLPTLPANIPFENDVYVATSEPHGSIMATVSRDSKFVARPRL